MSQMEDLKAARERLSAIEHALTRLKDAEDRLALVNKYVSAGQTWKPELTLKESDRGYYTSTPAITIRVPIPGGFIQQVAINEVVRCKRELNLLGYKWPKEGKK